MDDGYRKLDLAILALACETFTLASDPSKTSIVPQPTKETLFDAKRDLERASRELLKFWQEVQTKKNLEMGCCAFLASSFLDVFHVLKPLYPLYWAMHRECRDKKSSHFENLWLLIVDDMKVREINIFDSAVGKIVEKTCQDLRIQLREGFDMYTGLTLRLDQ
jgi:hypothetical protein